MNTYKRKEQYKWEMQSVSSLAADPDFICNCAARESKAHGF